MTHKILITALAVLFLTQLFGQNKNETKLEHYKQLVAILDTVHREDQEYREKSSTIEKEYGWDSNEMNDLWKIINEKDSINLLKVTKILDNDGWLGADKIGEAGNKTLFLVIQHSNTQTQLKYLPMLQNAVMKGDAKPNYLALLQDRVLLAQGEKQIYGSQLETDVKTGEYVLSPMIDPDNVDKRRAQVGLQPISEYLKLWNLTWNVEEFKKRMSEIEVKKEK